MYSRKLSNGTMEDMPKAKKVEIPGWENYEFFACRMDDPATNPEKEYKGQRPQKWCLYYAGTGQSLGWGDTRDKVAEYVYSMLEMWPRDIMEAILNKGSK